MKLFEKGIAQAGCVKYCLHMNANDIKRITAGTTLLARSIGDYNCVFKAEVLERKGQFVTVKAMNNIKRVKVFVMDGVECVYAFGKHSMAPLFKAA